MSLDQWVRLTTNALLLIPAVMATVYAFWLYLNRRQLFILFGALALAEFIPLLLLRIVAVPKPPLLSESALEIWGLIVNAKTSLFAMAWLVGLLRELNHVSKLRHKLLDEVQEDEL